MRSGQHCSPGGHVGSLGAIVLSGGQSRRLGGRDKPALRVGERSLLETAVDAVAAADPVVAVGPRRQLRDRNPLWTRETPAGAGPLAALAAGLGVLGEGPSRVAVLASDYPFVRAATMQRLYGALAGGEAGAILVDSAGNPQWLVGVWQVAALRAALPRGVEGASMRSVLAPLNPLRIPAQGREASDVDTPEDVRALGISGGPLGE